MTSKIKLGFIVFAISVFCVASLFAQYSNNPALTTQVLVEQYLDLVISGNVESARYLWWEDCRERANKFGIEYEDVFIKMDCTSPIFMNYEILRDYLYPPVQRVKHLPDSNYFQLEFNKTLEGNNYTHNFYVRSDGEYNYLIYPQDYFGAKWPVIETRFHRIHCHPAVEKYLNQVVLDEADNFIEKMAGILKLDKDDIKILEDRKIEYFYCDIDSTVQEITGKTTKGLFDLASNDIISAYFPHFHELTHLLVNIKLKHLPLYTLPLFQEGLAVTYGGRWGKNVVALNDIGIFIYLENLIEFDSSLTMSGFSERSGADIAYPVAGLFNEFLLDRIDKDKYFELYLEASGDVDELIAMTNEDVQNMIVEAADFESWDNCIDSFEAFLEKKNNENPGARPGQLNDGKIVFEDESVKVVSDHDWLGFEVTLPAGEPMVGNFQFGFVEELVDKKSSLFDEHYQGLQEFSGYRYGFRFDTNEAGIYDYGTNELVAKYIFGITPSEHYYDSTLNKLTVMFNREIFENEKLPEFKKYNFLPL